MPLFALFFMFTVLSSVGLPGLNGFVGEYLVLAGTFESAPLWAAISVSGVVLGAIYLLMATRRLLFGPLILEENKRLADIGRREVATLLPLVACALWIGIHPGPCLSKTSAALDRVADRIERTRAALVTGPPTPSPTEPLVSSKE
jgi:NADH-quinone oxidoreductase subunit M